MIKNPNHPKKGSRITVEPIRDEAAISTIQRLVADRPRDLLLFVMGINNGLRVGDLLKLKVRDVQGLKLGDTLKIIEGKTKKENILVVNKPVFKVLQDYINKVRPDSEDFLFASQKGGAITIGHVNRLVKTWCKAINLEGNFGAHSLRKTWGYHQRVKYAVGFDVIARRYNHASPATTMRYLGITSAEIHGILMNAIG